MEPDVQANIKKLQARIAIAADALMQVSEQLLAASSNIIVLKAMLGALVNLSAPDVREALKKTLHDLQPSERISGLPRAEFETARDDLLSLID